MEKTRLCSESCQIAFSWQSWVGAVRAASTNIRKHSPLTDTVGGGFLPNVCCSVLSLVPPAYQGLRGLPRVEWSFSKDHSTDDVQTLGSHVAMDPILRRVKLNGCRGTQANKN